MRWIWETYLERPEQRSDWQAAPMLGDLKGVAPAHLIVGSLDPLLDDSNTLAAKLKAAGVPCNLTIYQGINHGFIRYGRLIGTARRAVADGAAALRAGLAGGGGGRGGVHPAGGPCGGVAAPVRGGGCGAWAQRGCR